MKPIRLFLVDDHPLFREGLARLLESQPEFEVCGREGSVRDALTSLDRAHPDVILLDVDLGNERGLDLVHQMRQRQMPGRVLVVTAGVSDREAVQLVQAGVAGIFHKNKSPDILCSAIREVAGGGVHLESRYLRPLFETIDETHGAQPKLTEREIRIMRLILQGMANKEIGQELDVAESTVKAALRTLFEKVGVHTRSQLVRVALEQYKDLL